MANTFTAKNAANGQVAATTTTIYTVPASTVGYRPCVTFFNTNASSQTVILSYLPNGGSNRKIRQFILAQNESAVFDERMLLNAGDALQAISSNASAVDYTVSLVEEA